jgi:phosphatidate cytidylyltransferase
MLKQRVITAIVLLAILLPALFWRSPQPFLAITLVLIAASGWEWGRLNGLGPGANIALGLLTLVLCAGAWALDWPAHPSATLWSIVGALWVLAGAALVRAGVDGWPKIPRAVRVVGGLVAVVLAWLAMAQARVIGTNFLLSILVLVWVADVFAYFAGRAIGGKITQRKLAPVISPKKSWEGVWGGMLGVVVLAIVWALADGATQAQDPSLYSRLAHLGWPVLVLPPSSSPR